MQSQMRNRVVMVTGSTDGIGKQTALELASMGATVLLHGRNAEKGQQTLKEICNKTGNKELEFYLADLSSQKQIRELAKAIIQKHDKLHVLINNAGVYEPYRNLTEDGLEMTFAVNSVAPLLLTNLLLDLLKKSAPSRIIMVTSMAHEGATVDWDNLQGEKSYDGYEAYALSKLAVLLLAYELARRLEGTRVTVNCLHPGVIDTKLLRAGWGSGGADVKEGAETHVFLASSPTVENITGKYFDNKQPVSSSPLSYDQTLQKRFWQLGEKLIQTV
jgi:NAD(P)-dependent dehydrogenase (short-subunit alcohol dehydrogenase family)